MPAPTTRGKKKYFVDPNQPSAIRVGKKGQRRNIGPGEEIYLTSDEFEHLKSKGFHSLLLRELPEAPPLNMAQQEAELALADGVDDDTTTDDTSTDPVEGD